MSVMVNSKIKITIVLFTLLMFGALTAIGADPFLSRLRNNVGSNGSIMFNDSGRTGGFGLYNSTTGLLSDIILQDYYNSTVIDLGIIDIYTNIAELYYNKTEIPLYSGLNLGVYSDYASDIFNIVAEGESSSGIGVLVFSDDNVGALNFSRARGNLTTPTILQQNDVIGGVYWWGYNGTDFLPLAETVVSVENNATSNDMTSQMIFKTLSNIETGVESRMYIKSNGDVKVVNGTMHSNVVNATEYQVDGVVPVTNSTGFWMCTTSNCSSSCQVDINNGLVMSCE